MTIQVIGAGLGRTGTASLKVALERLGFGPSYHMGELMADLGVLPLWEQVAEGRPDWDTIFADYRSTTDYPACTYWRELMVYYPDAKVVLSTRDPESWFESVYATIMSPAIVGHALESPLATMFKGSVFRDFGDRIHDREFMVDYFRRHAETVRAEVPADKLLVFEARQGWRPLCEFLDVPVPDDPFPRVNSRAETEAFIAAVIASSQDEELQDTLRDGRHRMFTDPSDT